MSLTAQGRVYVFTIIAMVVGLKPCARGQIMLSGNENKFDLTQGGQKVIVGAKPDSLTLIDFSKMPPATFSVEGVANTVIGPPSNIAISPDGKMAPVANSVKVEGDKYSPESYVHVVDLGVRPPKVVGAGEYGIAAFGTVVYAGWKVRIGCLPGEWDRKCAGGGWLERETAGIGEGG